jgi:hypothetical protein
MRQRWMLWYHGCRIAVALQQIEAATMCKNLPQQLAHPNLRLTWRATRLVKAATAVRSHDGHIHESQVKTL